MLYIHEHPMPSDAVAFADTNAPVMVGHGLADCRCWSTAPADNTTGLRKRVEVSGVVSQVCWRGTFDLHVTLSNFRMKVTP